MNSRILRDEVSLVSDRSSRARLINREENLRSSSSSLFSTLVSKLREGRGWRANTTPADLSANSRWKGGGGSSIGGPVFPESLLGRYIRNIAQGESRMSIDRGPLKSGILRSPNDPSFAYAVVLFLHTPFLLSSCRENVSRGKYVQ